jgi:flagellar motor switch protein FliG
MGVNDMAVITQIDQLSGAEKAAVLLLTLGPDHGAPIWKALDEEEIRTISMIMSQLGTLTVDVAEKIMVDFTTNMSASGAIMGNFDNTEMLLSKLLPKEQADMIIQEIRGPSGRNIWQKLSTIDPELLANFLKSEYPQTAAVVCSKLKPDHAAQVLLCFQDELAVDIINRMLKLDNIQKEALDHIENTLRSEFLANKAQTNRRDPHEVMAVVFNSFDRQTENRFLAALDSANREAAKKIRALMFTFEDLTKLDPAGVQTLMRSVEKDLLARALKGASEPIKEFFLGNMSSRAAKNIQDDMGALGPMRMKDVDEAQSKIVNIAKELAEKGDIMISKNRAEDELVY